MQVLESLIHEDGVSDDLSSETTRSDMLDSETSLKGEEMEGEEDGDSTLELAEDIAILDCPQTVEYIKQSRVSWHTDSVIGK